MLSEELSSQILTISCAFNPPKGGVAQVVYTYSKEVYPVFKSVENSKSGPKIRNLWSAVTGMIKTIWILLTDRKIKIVHIHSASRTSFYRSMIFVNLSHFFKKRVVMHIHGGGFKEFYKTNPQKIKKKLLSCDAVLALTGGWNKFFSKEVGLPNVWTVNNIVSQPLLRNVREKDNRIHLLFLGLIDDFKGIFELIEVVDANKSLLENKLVLHIGGNGQIDRLKRMISEKGLCTMVNYEGWVSGEKKNELLNQADVFILPSHIEGLPIAILEALSYGIPVITTPVGGIPEIVNNSNGWIFTPGDKQSLTNLLKEIILDPQLITVRKEYASKSVEANLPEDVSRVLDQLYNCLLISKS